LSSTFPPVTNYISLFANMRISSAISIAASLGCAAAQNPIVGFNCGASDDQGNPKTQEDFEREFRTVQNLEGAPDGINTIRLYSNVQWETQDTPITALSAAVATNTSLLLGIWASGTDSIDNELNALEAALEEHGSDLADLVVGISVGSEDLYRASKAGERNDAGIGNGPDTIVRFITSEQHGTRRQAVHSRRRLGRLGEQLQRRCC
jgi:glucan endo-1,3-beta-D-glucosidase